MTQDFAKPKRTSTKKPTRKPRSKTRSNSKRSPSNSQKAPTWAWLVIGSLLAALITLLVYLANLPSVETNTSTGAPQRTSKPSDARQIPQPRFDFYQILKEQEVEVPDRSSEVVSADDNTVYYLQVGSFRNQADADELRIELILMNLEASIEDSRNENGLWHRVIVGPFDSRSKMAKARSVLASNELNTLLLKRKTK